ncbi:DMT family transporter [Rhizobacter sp. Root404]|uniref:DMT family transporter n=1 Tax=Rhizobacter sp. Root404 TaxID=1736528 RepID=UPI001F1B143C|nr:DMT family transporter [Rhizobacter sp. Root404]
MVALAALWGGSFLFVRMGAGEFGPVALAALRVTGAALVLMPLLAARHQLGALRWHWRPILVVGITNSALPFLLFAYAALSITAGLAAIFNAASPLFGALIAWAWLKDRLTTARVVGLAIGFAGVLGLAWDSAGFKTGGSGWAAPACIAAALFYGLSASVTKRHLSGVPPLAVAAGSQLAAALVMAVPAALWWPVATPSPQAWMTTAMLAVLCTGVAYLLYFRLIAHVGPANAIAVTFLIPAFAVLWGWIFLGEALTLAMLLGCAVILVGTALATGLLKPRESRAADTAAGISRLRGPTTTRDGG